MDRFLMKEVLTYPAPDEEVEIVDRIESGSMTAPLTAQPITVADVMFLQSLVTKVYVDSSIKQYVVALINTTRDRKSTRLNSSHVASSHAVFCLHKTKST